jgi:hypothetical protein
MELKQQYLNNTQQIELFDLLKARFVKNKQRHPSLQWPTVLQRLETNAEKLWSLWKMEDTGGEPDAIGQDSNTGEIIFCDCSAESPKGRRSLCYDHEALESRKEYKPADSAINLASYMGITMLDEFEYRELQKLGNFDAKTSSWIITPPEIRKLGGALFADFRFNHVFTYHNGAESYYAARGFRGLLKI